MMNVALQQDHFVRSAAPYSPLRAETEAAPILSTAQRAAMDVGASREQACWIAISWALTELTASGADAEIVAAQLEQIALDLRISERKLSIRHT